MRSGPMIATYVPIDQLPLKSVSDIALYTTVRKSLKVAAMPKDR